MVMVMVSCPCAELIKQWAIKAYVGVDVEIHVFLAAALVGCEWSATRPGHNTHWIGSRMNPRIGLDLEHSAVQPIARRYTDWSIRAP
jgi:hypothetical protein